MSRTTKQPLIRLACQIAASAARKRCQTVADAMRNSSQTLESHWETVQLQQSRVAKAIDRGWFLAARRVLSDGRFDRDAVSPKWDQHCRAVDDFLRRSTPGLTISELHTELQDMAEEFEEVGWDKRWL